MSLLVLMLLPFIRFGAFCQLYGKRVISNEAGRCKSFSYVYFPDRTHVPVGARIVSVSGASVHLRHPNLLSLLRSSTWCCPPVISSITIDHDEFFDLPFQGGG